MKFIRDLIETIVEKNCPVCMGLDPRMDNEGEIPKYLVEELQEPDKIILEFNKTLLDATHDLIPVIKPQIAFYEKYEALKALKETIKYAHKKNLLVILDSKRNDIGSTSEAYAYSMFRVFEADACTVNAYLGLDSVKPFIDYKDKGVFILLKTSNPSSREFQDLFSVNLNNIPSNITEIKMDSVVLERNYVQMAKLVREWSDKLEKYQNYHNLGVVAGVTFPEELKIIRKILENSFILMPGYGVQGAKPDDVKYGFNKEGLGGIINSSRGIIYAYGKKKKYPPEKFAQAAREEVLQMKKEINSSLGK